MSTSSCRPFFLALGIALGSLALSAQEAGHPGVQQKIADGCDGSYAFDESIGEWVCTGGSGGSGTVQTCTTSDCPAKNENGLSVLNCFYAYRVIYCIKVCRHKADGTADYG